MPNAVSSGSLYDNVNNAISGSQAATAGTVGGAQAAQGKILKPTDTLRRQTSVDKQQQSEICQMGVKTATVGIGTTNVASQARRAWFLQDQASIDTPLLSTCVFICAILYNCIHMMLI